MFIELVSVGNYSISKICLKLIMSLLNEGLLIIIKWKRIHSEEIMDLIINNCKVYYEKQGEKGKALILLHGWGQNTTMMKPIADHFENNFQVYNIDFPGFGKSEEPKEPWGVEEYTEFLHQFILNQKIEQPILLGHSFGARVSLLYASKYPVEKMIITGGAGIRPKRGIGYYVRVYSYKAMKAIMKLPILNKYNEKLQTKFGSDDYKNTSGVMRNSFVKIVNLDLTGILSSISAEVLLVWGDQDDATPLWMGKKMEELIPNAGLAIFEGEGHYAYWNQMGRFLKVLDIFLEKDKVS